MYLYCVLTVLCYGLFSSLIDIFLHLHTGCTSLLFQLSVLLFEAGDSVLVPSPYYPAFDHDFHYLGKLYYG